MESLGQILIRMRQSEQDLTPTQKAEAEATYRFLEEQEHFKECGRCSGRDPAGMCSREEGYQEYRRRRAAGLPVKAYCTFKSFLCPPGEKAAVRSVKGWAEKPDGWVMLVGGRGSGKTHLALAATEEILGTNGFCRFWQVASLLDYWRRLYSQEELDPAGHMEALDRFPVLLDDLGAERPTEWAVEKLGQFLDRRYRLRLPTLITTNLGEDEMANRLGWRIEDRVFDTGSGLVQVILMKAPSYRRGNRR